GFEIIEVDTGEQAKAYLLSDIPAGASIGVSGSVSVRETGVLDALRQRGHTIFSHWDVTPQEVEPTRAKANGADVYLTSANALTRHGELILIDGAGNRVSAVAYGPKNVYFVVSHSKWVDGGYGKAIARIKKEACPPNARRQDKELPCAVNNECDPEACTADSMCRMTLSVNRAPRNRKMVVVFVKENLGY
ncbi:MAG: lactate utilization protein, partial [Firmicutes bacterium]|nr:lactate utilization protein [Bacillota bacterium]